MTRRARAAAAPADVWHELLDDADAGRDDRLCGDLAARMREARLTFGGRLLCPFARPFFLHASDEARVRDAAELLAAVGERVAQAALDSPHLLATLGLGPEEERLARLDPGYRRASTASRVDAFLLPGSLQFAEYNAESPAGPGYAHRLCELFETLPLMRRFRERFDVRAYRSIDALLEALVASYHEWGGTAAPPRVAIVDWREVPTLSEFELLRDAFVALGVPTVVADPRDLDFSGGSLFAGGRRIDLVYRRVLINDIVARPQECRALVDAYAARAVCVANTFRCKLPHKKTFFAVLTDDRFAHLFSDAERARLRRHVPWTRRLADATTTRDGGTIELLPWARRHRDRLVLKPSDEYGGSGVTLGWEADERDWDRALDRAVAERDRAWIVQERIAVRRETFPMCGDAGAIERREMLVDFAPYLFRGRLSGFLTRLSATGLANVTSGGGQVPAFVVDQRGQSRLSA
jgi:uncharacterized circularly permuted ATP-grasp superfamily protein